MFNNMRASIICGSRDGGFTSEMCRSFSKGLAVHGVSSEIFFPLGMNIEHCTGCGACSADGRCVISDDMDAIYEAFEKSSLLILTSPIRFSGPSSVIKTVIDRFQPVWFKGRGHPAYAAALLSGGSMTPYFTNTVSILKVFSLTAGMEWLGYLGIPDTDEKETRDVSAPAFDYGKEIALTVIKDP
ncbi:MAG: flavodoxin family protein [Candidatus Methanoplasma sp.]|jgi:multimeric flavodoxin WrbA|nr:flavodoxin family protein [Candidatus Methanoplasma sp.]